MKLINTTTQPQYTNTIASDLFAELGAKSLALGISDVLTQYAMSETQKYLDITSQDKLSYGEVKRVSAYYKSVIRNQAMLHSKKTGDLGKSKTYVNRVVLDAAVKSLLDSGRSPINVYEELVKNFEHKLTPELHNEYKLRLCVKNVA